MSKARLWTRIIWFSRSSGNIPFSRSIELANVSKVPSVQSLQVNLLRGKTRSLLGDPIVLQVENNDLSIFQPRAFSVTGSHQDRIELVRDRGSLIRPIVFPANLEEALKPRKFFRVQRHYSRSFLHSLLYFKIALQKVRKNVVEIRWDLTLFERKERSSSIDNVKDSSRRKVRGGPPGLPLIGGKNAERERPDRLYLAEIAHNLDP